MHAKKICSQDRYCPRIVSQRHTNIHQNCPPWDKSYVKLVLNPEPFLDLWSLYL